MSGKRPSTLDLHQLRVEIPRGFADYWTIIRELDAAGPWTIAMVAGRTRSHHEVVARYVRRLAKGGFAEAAGTAESRGPKAAILYRLLSSPTEAPRLREDGSECPPTSQEQMWRAIRSLTQFDARELAYAASTDVVQVHLEAAKGYIARLTAAGYLTEVRPSNGRAAQLAIWRLKPAMNTGPVAPIVMHTRLVWDPNRNEVMGAAVAAEVMAR